MTALLGIDLGERRIGVALADGPDVGARPLVTLPRGRTIEVDAAAVLELIERHDVSELVVGLPIDAAGHEGPQAIATRGWVDGLTSQLGDRVRLSLRDERMTSHVGGSARADEPRQVGRTADPHAARRVSCAGRPGSRGDHPSR